MVPINPTQLARMEWPWKAENLAGSIILVSDEQFVKLASFPDQAVEKPSPWFEQPVSLHEFCRQLAEAGGTKIHIAFDYFFGGSGRGLYPDTPEFQENLKKIHDVAYLYGLGIEPSVLSPLEMGVGYRQKTGETGRWMQYGEGLRDPETGRYSVMMWQHQQWVNNKGPIPIKLVGAQAFTFYETPVPGTTYFAVDPARIIELPTPQIETYPGTKPIHYGAPEVAENPGRQFQAMRVRSYGDAALSGIEDQSRFDRVLVVFTYETVEMDYFSPSAAAFINELVVQIHEQGIELEGVYSDEMHIQQDWVYHHHLDYGQFTLRYVSPGFERAFAEKYGEQYRNFNRWLVYFTCHQHHFLATHESKLPNQHVFGPRPEDITATLQFRRNYYHFLEETVVNLMIAGREKLEQLQGRPLDAFYHATWAESPTCDAWSVDGAQRDWSPEEHRRKYEYTPEFVWSNTIQQAASACANYFAWNEFLTGGNNDIPEGGFADRDYYGRAIACSLAALNRQPLASCGMWGMPGPINERMQAINAAYGAGGHSIFRAVQEYAPRQVEVLFLYPQDLVAVEERFGSWMVQYGYANYITADKLVEYGHVASNGWLEVKGSRYRAVCALYEPLPSSELLQLLGDFAHQGGTLVWSSIPPLVNREELAQLLGVRFLETPDPLGLALPARQVEFGGVLRTVAPMTILTDFGVDRVFPMHPHEGTNPIASLRPGGNSRPLCIGALRHFPGGGQAVTLGFRPRDDQAASTGAEVRTWFEVLQALGAYPGADNPTVISRTSNLLACTFPNGALSLAPHFSQVEESWSGGFFRDPEKDSRVLENLSLPDDRLNLDGLRLAGQVIRYQGRHCVSWQYHDGQLRAFAGLDCRGISLEGQEYSWADSPVEIAWHPLKPELAINGYLPLFRVWCNTLEPVRIPLGLSSAPGMEVWLGAPLTSRRRKPDASPVVGLPVGYGIHQIPFELAGGDLRLQIDEETCGHWLYVVSRF